MKRKLQGAVIAVGGLLLAGVQVVQASSKTTTTFLIETVPFVLLSLTITYTGYWLVCRPGAETGSVIGAWAAGGAVGFAALSALMITSINVTLSGFPLAAAMPAFVIDNVTIGVLAGLLIGLYDAKNRAQLDELENQRDRIEQFANRAADMNNYGQALNRCGTMEEVSAFCVEAVATLIDIDETAFVEHRGGVPTIVDSTIVGISEETIGELARRGSDADPATVVTHTDDLPAELDDDVESVITILVTDTEATSISIVALNRGDVELTEETTGLIEMLVSHAGTALTSIYSPEQRPPDDGFVHS